MNHSISPSHPERFVLSRARQGCITSVSFSDLDEASSAFSRRLNNPSYQGAEIHLIDTVTGTILMHRWGRPMLVREAASC